jgi:biopolymer transport protein ExbD
MPRLKTRTHPRPSMPIAPMIDCVFLMLIYFMVTSSLERQEADIAFSLPGLVEQSDPLELPDEQIIELSADGQVVVNEYRYDYPEAPRFAELAAMLHRFREACEANKVECVVTIAPDDATPHRMIVKVMDAIARAGIDHANFALAEE